MKKTLVSAAVFCAVCGSAMASSVTLYGVVDTGLNYMYVDPDESGVSSLNQFSMASGQTAGSRFGLKGIEDVADGFKVGFVLENGFKSDTGALGSSGTIFDREAQLFIDTNYGKLSFGRVALLHTDTGSYGMLGDISAFGTGWGNFIGNQAALFAYKPTRMNNVVTYVSPSFSGFKVHAQYAMGDTASKTDKVGTQVENKSSTNRYYALGASFEAGNFGVYGLVDYTNKASWSDLATDTRMRGHGKDQYTITLGGNYDFEVAKVYFGAQYFDNATSVGGEDSDDGIGYALAPASHTHGYGDLEGYGIIAGTDVPVCGGTFKFSAGYMHAESDKSTKEVTRWIAGAGYVYPVSKRTNVYAGAGYLHDTADNSDPYAVEVAVGLKHSF